MASETESSPYVDAENERIVRPSTAETVPQQVLSAGGTDSLREEAIRDDGTARQWDSTVSVFEDYVMSQHAAADTWEEEKGIRPSSHRFTPQKAREYEGKIRGGLRWIRDNAPDSLPLTTVMLTRTGWPYDGDGQPAPPVEFLHGLQQGRAAALDTLRDVLTDVPCWGRVSVREPHDGRRAGYPHCHDGLVVVGVVTAEDFRPVIESHVDADPFARACDHGDGAITVMDARADPTAVEGLAAELVNSIIGYAFDTAGGSPLDGVTPAEERFASLLWATGRQSVTFGRTFREWVDRSQEDYIPDADSTATATFEAIDPEATVEYVDPEPTDVAYTFPDSADSG